MIGACTESKCHDSAITAKRVAGRRAFMAFGLAPTAFATRAAADSRDATAVATLRRDPPEKHSETAG